MEVFKNVEEVIFDIFFGVFLDSFIVGELVGVWVVFLVCYGWGYYFLFSEIFF